MEKVKRFKFLGVHITEDLSRSSHTRTVMKKAQQRLLSHRSLKLFVTGPQILRNLYSCTIESILTGCINVWYGNCITLNRKALQKVVRTA